MRELLQLHLILYKSPSMHEFNYIYLIVYKVTERIETINHTPLCPNKNVSNIHWNLMQETLCNLTCLYSFLLLVHSHFPFKIYIL